MPCTFTPEVIALFEQSLQSGNDQRFVGLLARKPIRIATVAMANKLARIAWAIMTRGEVYKTSHLPALAA